MGEKYVLVEIKTADPAQKEIFIALLNDIGFEGFEEQKDLLKAFIPEKQYQEEGLKSLAGSLGITYTLSTIENKNWNEVWESSFEPVVVDTFCGVRAGFHSPLKHVKHEIIITPKMSFGTGHHATTYMMLLAMKDLDFRGKKVFDFGTGTGVLAILAVKCGASSVDAIDNDDWSIENAMENMSTNQASGIHVYKSETLPAAGSWDIILANINRNVILKNLPVMRNLLTTNGKILLSGLLASDEPDVHEKALASGLVLNNKWEKHNWICLAYVSA